MLVGCNNDLTYSKVNVSNIGSDLQSRIENVKDGQGVHLIYGNDDKLFVYLSQSVVKQGEPAVHYTSFEIKQNDNTLEFYYSSEETMDYSNPDLDHELLYRVENHEQIDVLKLFHNGTETSFGTIGS